MPTSLITNTLAVLAFTVGFYTLLARERKTPYITVFLFRPAALLFAVIVLESLSQTFSSWSLPKELAAVHQTQFSELAGDFALCCSWGARIFFYCGVFWIVTNIWRLHNRQVNFRDDKLVRNLTISRWVKRTLSKLSTGRSYEHNPASVEQVQIRSIVEKHGFQVFPDRPIRTLVSCKESLLITDRYTANLAAEFLRNEWLIQYTTCDRHPIEWIGLLKTVLGADWGKYASRLVVVDGYTPHFGFTDSIHPKKSAEVTSEGVFYFASSESYAGVHTATLRAFNEFKKRSGGKEARKPQLLIYEGCRSLVDLESIEQYRIYLRHVITSERMWGSMVTLFLEPEAQQSEIDLMSTYADSVRNRPAEVADDV